MTASMFKYDIRGFINALKVNFSGAVHEALIRHVYGRLFRVLYGYGSLPSWLGLFSALVARRRFLLVVLDDARFDAFRSVYGRYVRGYLRPVRVPPPNTYGWLPRAFSDVNFDGVRVFYASLSIETHDIMIGRFVPRGRSVEVVPIRPGRMRDLGTVLPSEVNEVVRRVGLSGRDVVWYAQPHFPWVSDLELSRLLIREVLLHDFVPPDLVADKLRRLGVSRRRVVNAYYGNMVLALMGVRELLGYVRESGVRYDSIVVTSDHGEMLGELGLYLHQEYDLPQLVIVPWLEVVL